MVLILFICYLFSEKIILTPQFTFTLSFIPSVFYALFYVKHWQLELTGLTIVTLIGGVSLFVLASIVMSGVGRKISVLRVDSGNSTLGNDIKIERWKLIVFLMLQILILGWLYYFLISATGKSVLSQTTMWRSFI